MVIDSSQLKEIDKIDNNGIDFEKIYIKPSVFVEFEVSDEWAIRQIPGFVICPDYVKYRLKPIHLREWGLVEGKNVLIRYLLYIRRFDKEGK